MHADNTATHIQSAAPGSDRHTALKVGQLARRTGLSVRTLHHYDELGLLSPSRRTESGHRLYTAGDITRLQQIMSLRQLGFSLGEIKECLGRADFSPQRVLRLHIAALKKQMVMQQRLCERLESVAAELGRNGVVSVDQFIKTIEEITAMEKEFSPEQMQQIKKRGEMLGEEHIRQVEAEWPRLMEQVRTEMDNGTDPADPRVQALAARWMELVREFTGGDPGIERVLRNRYQEDPTGGHPQGDPRMLEYMEYITKARQVSGSQS